MSQESQEELGNKEIQLYQVEEVKDEDFTNKHQPDLFEELISHNSNFEFYCSQKDQKEVVRTGEDLKFLKSPEVESGHLEQIPSEKLNIPSKIAGDMDE